MNIPRHKGHPPMATWEVRCVVALNNGTVYVHPKGFEKSYQGTEIRSFYYHTDRGEERVRDQIHDAWLWKDCTFHELLEVREVSS